MFEAQLKVLRKRWAAAAISAALAVAYLVIVITVGGAAAARALDQGGLLGWLIVTPGALIALFGVRRFYAKDLRDPVLVKADARGITLGTRFIPRAQIRAGMVVTQQVVRVELDLGPRPLVEIEVERREQGVALLSALKLDTAHAVARFGTLLHKPFFESKGLLAMGAITLLATVVNVQSVGLRVPQGLFGLLLGIAVGTAFVAAAFLRSADLVVGADGLELGWTWNKRFVSYRDLLEVESYRVETLLGSNLVTARQLVGIELRLRSDEIIQVPLEDTGGAVGGSSTDAVKERIDEALEAFRRGEDPSGALVLEQRGRSISEWVAALQRMGSGVDASFRTAPVPIERLLRTVEDLTQPPTVRAAAAVALSKTPDPEVRTRVRVASEATAEPRLRIALERASSDAKHDEIVEALAAVSTSSTTAS